MSEVKIGGVLPLAPHTVDLSFTLSQDATTIEGVGSVDNLLGDHAALALTSGPQRGEIKGVVVDGIAELWLAIPPFGAPPAAASVVFVGKATKDGLVGMCHTSISGGESTPAPCNLARVLLDDVVAAPPSKSTLPRAEALARRICDPNGGTIAESDGTLGEAAREAVGALLADGLSDEEILAWFRDRYGSWLVLPVGRGSNACRLPDDHASPLIGRRAPSFALEDLQGKRITMESLRGRPVILNFWASWCVPCRIDASWFRDTAAKYPGTAFLGIDFYDDPGEARAHFGSNVATYPILITPPSLALEFGVTGVPETFFIDADGVIRHHVLGPVSPSSLDEGLRRSGS